MASTWARTAEFESNASLEGISDSDIHFSRLTGTSPNNIEHLRIFTVNEALLIVIRCPKRAARFWHGKYQPKTMATGTSYPGLKSQDDGLVHFPDGSKQVSDYDLMCVYRLEAPGKCAKIFLSGVDPNNKRSRLGAEAALLLRKVNSDLKSRFQHGGQDDFRSKDNPGVKYAIEGQRSDRFIAFNYGRINYLATPMIAKDYYAKKGLEWPYTLDDRREGKLKIPE